MQAVSEGAEWSRRDQKNKKLITRTYGEEPMGMKRSGEDQKNKRFLGGLRKVFLEGLPLGEAIERWEERLRDSGCLKPTPPESVRVIDSLGRITAEAIFAKISSPFFHSAAMDGFAVRFPDTFGASETNPILLKIGERAYPVDTGDPIPDGFNAVIMIEDVNIVKKGNEDFIEIIAPATPWQHVRTIGEDIIETELIIPQNHRIRPIDIGAMLAGGHSEIKVRKRPLIAIMPTGDEIVEPGTPLKIGNIIEFNSRVLEGMIREEGGKPIRYDIVPDDKELLKEKIIDSLAKADLSIINAGSSTGSEDYTATAIAELGEVVVHGVGIKPGKPVILGIVKGKPVLGIPGYPVSMYITYNLFVRPLLYKLQGLMPPEPDKMKAVLSRNLPSSLGQEEFVRVKVGFVKDKVIATPVGRGAGVIMSLVRADGILRIPSLSEGIGAGTEVEVELIRKAEEIKNTIVCIGSHDNTLDILSNFLRIRYPRFTLSSAHVGSMGGIMAIKKGEAHLAGTHLLDEDSGEYNIPFLKRLLPDIKLKLINLVYRQQGLIVKKGNPKGITGFKDLLRDDITFINRQRGSGTRLLTDKCLREQGISPERIKGYEREEFTHMGVAGAVLTGIADVGIGILAAAKALDLDFIPLTRERYDLIIPSEYLDSEPIRAVIDIIMNDSNFRETILKLGGYDCSDMGKIIWSNDE